MKKNSFSIKNAVSYGWKKSTSNVKFFVVLFLIFIAANAVPGILAGIFNEGQASFLGFAMQLIGWGLQLIVSLGLINVALRLHDNKKTVYKDLFANVNLIIPYLFGSIIYGIVVFVGFVLLIIPGIIWSIKFRYFPYFMVDRNMGPIDAMRESAKITKGVKWQLFLFGLTLILINILGALAFVVGLFITVPLSMMAEAYVFRKLTSK